MTELDDDIIALMSRRVYDLAGICHGVRVTFNGEKLPVKNFKDYCDLILAGRTNDFPVIHEVVNDRWEVCMTVSDSGFQQVSFVNSIATSKGGTHVNYVTDQIVKKLAPIIAKKNKAVPVKNHQIKAHLWVFVNALVENPTFDSQTKENLTLPISKFGSKCDMSDKFTKGMIKSGVIDNILVWAKVKGQELMGKKSGGAKHKRLTGIAKLDDANEAGGRNGYKCTLILTEGDSAKSLALSGLSVIGRDYYGVFPLKGKPLNVREASHKQIMENQEIKSIVEIMGLQFGKEYDEDSIKKLRYGRLMIMADQDQDGSHIKALIINFVHHFWPSLLKLDDFIVEFITPIVKATKGAKSQTFFTLPEFQTWMDEIPTTKGWAIKYYKGLGTSTPKEAKDYFSAMEDHQKQFYYSGPEDDAAIDMAFSKKKIEERKQWLRNFKAGTFLDHTVDKIPYTDFINHELILFSMADNVRSIPSMVDGFKPGQRKILFSCFKRKLTSDIKVAQLAGYVAEHSAYHHGEVSLTGTIVNMAQSHVGSNNVTLLVPSGQFGTRIQGGKDAASPRYIFTRLDTMARKIFHPHDDALLNQLEEEGHMIEPSWYMPIIPMVLVNGSDGIGTGHSSKVPNYDARQICANLRHMMASEPLERMYPSWRGFQGECIPDPKKSDRFILRGKYNKINETTLEIVELPIREWTQDYKMFLEGLLTGEEGPGAFQSKAKAAKAQPKEPSIKDYKEYHTDTTVRFEITMSEEQMAAAEAIGFTKKFKLESSTTTSNMTLFDSEGRLKKYSTAEQILTDFFEIRLTFYQKRKDYLADKLTEEWTRLDNKVRFILALINDTFKIRNRPKREILSDLKSKGFTAYPKQKKNSTADQANDNSDDEESDEVGASDYDYLLGMPFWSLTMEKVEKLKSERDGKETELNTLLAQTPEDIWCNDLDELESALDEMDDTYAASEESTRKLAAKSAKNQGKGGKKKKKANDSEDDDWAPTASKKKAAPRKKIAKVAPVKVVEKSAPLVRPRSPAKDVPPSPATKSPSPKMAKRGRQTKKIVYNFEDSDSDEGESMSLADRLAAKEPAPKAAPLPVASKKSKAVDEDEQDDIDDILLSVSGSESDGYAPPAKVAKQPAKKARATKKAAPKSKLSKVETAEDEDAYDFEAEPAPKKAAPKKAAAKAKPRARAKKQAIVESEDEDFAPEGVDSDDDFEIAPKAKKAPAKKAAAAKKAPAKKAAAKKAPAKKAPAKKRAPPKKKAAVFSDDDFDPDQSDAMDVPSPAAAAVARPARSRRAASKAVKYTFDEEGAETVDEEDESEIEMFDEESGSDFEP